MIDFNYRLKVRFKINPKSTTVVCCWFHVHFFPAWFIRFFGALFFSHWLGMVGFRLFIYNVCSRCFHSCVVSIIFHGACKTEVLLNRISVIIGSLNSMLRLPVMPLSMPDSYIFFHSRQFTKRSLFSLFSIRIYRSPVHRRLHFEN